jgi:hypothetical protein
MIDCVVTIGAESQAKIGRSACSFPPVEELASEYSVARITVDQALAHIRKHQDVWVTTGTQIIDAYKAATGTSGR